MPKQRNIEAACVLQALASTIATLTTRIEEQPSLIDTLREEYLDKIVIDAEKLDQHLDYCVNQPQFDLPRLKFSEVDLLLTCLSACTRSGGGGFSHSLLRKLSEATEINPITSNVVRKQHIAHDELHGDDFVCPCDRCQD